MKKLLFIISALVLCQNISAQVVKDYFKNSPKELLISVDSINRVRMCDLKEQGLFGGAVTIFGDTITVIDMKDDFMSFSYSNADVQIRLADKKTIIVSKTVSAPLADSELYFYDTDWELKSSWIYGAKRSKMVPNDKELFAQL